MGDLMIRSARSSDLEEVLDLRLSLQHHVEASNPWLWWITDEGKRDLRKELEQMFADEECGIIVASEGGGLIGFASGRVSHREDYSPPNVGYILEIYVRDRFRGRGVGSRLVEGLCRFFRSENVEDVTLRYALGNREAEGFWSDLGFKPIIVTANTHLNGLEERLGDRVPP